MNDPHVEELHYLFISESTTDNFDQSEPLNITLEALDLHLEQRLLVVRPHKHFDNEETAKQSIEPLLRSWESSAFLNEYRYKIRFKFDHAVVVDRKPETGNTVIQVHAIGVVTSVGNVTVIRVNKYYPQFDPTFMSSLLTDELEVRLKRYWDGREPITSLAYWFLTKLEKEYGSRKGISRALNVSENILSTLGKLSSSSDPLHTRKATGTGPFKLRPIDIEWLEAVTMRLARRVGEVNAGLKSSTALTMADFPTL